MKGEVYVNDRKAGVLERMDNGEFTFQYEPGYVVDNLAPPVSLTLPKTTTPFVSSVLFSFFAGLLSEGINKEIQCRLLKIDEDDEFGRLLATAGDNTIGFVTIKKIEP